MAKPDLSIIIVSWNVEKLLGQCLTSIFVQAGDLDLEIIVVDNNSSDQTAARVKNDFPAVQLIANKKNLGFAAANNIGLKQSQSDFILILNPDTIIQKNTLSQMLKFMAAKPKIGIAGCKHLNPDRTLQPSVRRFPGFWPLFLIFTKIAKIWPNLPALKKYLAKDFNYNLASPVDQVAGSFMLIRKKVFDAIGLFDEKFFTWFEEVDLCFRAKAASWEIWYNPSAQIIHFGGQSFKQQLTVKNQKNFWQSAWYYLKKTKKVRL